MGEGPALTPELEAKVRKMYRRWPQSAEATLSILRHFPWREFLYKRGRWERTATPPQKFWKWFSDDTHEWTREYRNIQVIDPDSGQAISELYVGNFAKLERPRGRVWIAGDPRTVAVWMSPKDGIDDFGLGSARFLDDKAEAEYGLAMRPGVEPPFPVPPYDWDLRYGGSLWLADRPTKPTREDGYDWDDWKEFHGEGTRGKGKKNSG